MRNVHEIIHSRTAQPHRQPGTWYRQWCHSRQEETIANRQYDAECVVCHVTGFGYKSGFADEKSGKELKLDNVGCESCHGPGLAHVNDKNNVKIQKEMNPWKDSPRGREAAIGAMCMKCHDDENDVNWKFKDRWSAIDHPSPKKGGASGGSGTGSKDDK